MIIPVFRPMDGADRAKDILDPVPQYQLIIGHIADAQGTPVDLWIFRVAKRLVVQRIDQQGCNFRPHQAAGNANDVPSGRGVSRCIQFQKSGNRLLGKDFEYLFPDVKIIRPVHLLAIYKIPSGQGKDSH